MPQTRAKLTTPRYRKRHSVGFMPVAPKRTRYTGILHRSRHSTVAESKDANYPKKNKLTGIK